MFAGDRIALDIVRHLHHDAEQRAAEHRLVQSLDAAEPLRSRILRAVGAG